MLRSRLPSAEVVPSIIGNIVSTTRLVNPEEIDRSAIGANLNTDATTAGKGRPVCDAIAIDFAAEDANRGGVSVVRRNEDAVIAAKFRSNSRSYCGT